VPHRGSGSPRRDRAAAEVVAWTDRGTARQLATVLDRDGSLRRCPSSEPQAAGAWARRPADAGEVRAPLLEGAEERLPRCRSNCRGGSTTDHEDRRDANRPSAYPSSAVPPAGTAC